MALLFSSGMPWVIEFMEHSPLATAVQQCKALFIQIQYSRFFVIK